MEKTMRDVFKRLLKELGYEEGKYVFEWYCQTYNVTIADKCPPTIEREVFC